MASRETATSRPGKRSLGSKVGEMEPTKRSKLGGRQLERNEYKVIIFHADGHFLTIHKMPPFSPGYPYSVKFKTCSTTSKSDIYGMVPHMRNYPLVLHLLRAATTDAQIVYVRIKDNGHTLRTFGDEEVQRLWDRSENVYGDEISTEEEALVREWIREDVEQIIAHEFGAFEPLSRFVNRPRLQEDLMCRTVWFSVAPDDDDCVRQVKIKHEDAAGYSGGVLRRYSRRPSFFSYCSDTDDLLRGIETSVCVCVFTSCKRSLYVQFRGHQTGGRTDAFVDWEGYKGFFHCIVTLGSAVIRDCHGVELLVGETGGVGFDDWCETRSRCRDVHSHWI